MEEVSRIAAMYWVTPALGVLILMEQSGAVMLGKAVPKYDLKSPVQREDSPGKAGTPLGYFADSWGVGDFEGFGNTAPVYTVKVRKKLRRRRFHCAAQSIIII